MTAVGVEATLGPSRHDALASKETMTIGGSLALAFEMYMPTRIF